MFFNKIRLNKTLRELSISLDQAVEYLESIGIEIEARPTVKISNEVYNVLIKKFEKKFEKKYTPKPKFKENIASEWDKEAEATGIQLVHPSYQDDETFIMGKRGAKELRDFEREEPNKSYLVIREAIRRHLKGKTTKHNNYIKLAVRAFKRLQERIVDEKLNLTGTYYPKGFTFGVSKSKQISAGTDNGFGYLWVPYFRVFVPFEEFDLLNRIGMLKGTWNNTTLRIGKEKGNVAKYRQEALVNGYADGLLKKFNLPSYYKDKLTVNYTSRS